MSTKIVALALFALICTLLCGSSVNALEQEKSRTVISTVSKVELANYIKNDSDLEYYAYMNLETADEELTAVILEARKRIIFSSDGWAADGVDAYVTGSNGTIVEKLPQFSDVFPPDWEQPKTDYR